MANGARGKGSGIFDTLAPGLYAWGLTVGWPVSQRFAPLGARISALVALVALVAGAALVFSAPLLSRVLGIWVFLAGCIGTWGWFAQGFAPLHLDPIHGVLGTVGWALFALNRAGDGATIPTPPLPSGSPAPVDEERSKRPELPRAAKLVLFVVTLAAAVPMVLSWWVESVERALLAHAVSLAAAIAMVAFAVDLFEPRPLAERAGFIEAGTPERRIAAALPAFVALTALAVLGAVYTLLR